MAPRVASTTGSVNAWIQRATQRHLGLLDDLRDKLEASLDLRPDLDPETQEQRRDDRGNAMWLQADLNERGTPSRDWCRAFGRYQVGFLGVIGAEQERAKLQLLARRAGMDALTDEEYAKELVDLGRDAVKEISDDEFKAEAARRGMRLPAG